VHIDELLAKALKPTFHEPVAIDIERESQEHDHTRVRGSRVPLADGSLGGLEEMLARVDHQRDLV
jgi:hypothetical protein